jgi:penicillin amidase
LRAPAEATLAALDGETRALVDAYAEGVNAFIAGGPRPLELQLLRVRPEPWRAIDTLAWAQVMAWGLSVNWDSELLNAALVARLGPARAARLMGEYPRENPLVVPGAEWEALLARVEAELRAAEPWLPLAGLRGMSNNWVIDGAKSSTGKPLLANDPHLAPQMPSIWYENHLVCPELEASGVSMPGAPGVVIGHNAEIAWGFTAAVPDTQDLYFEEFDAADRTRYRFRGEWERATVVREEIRVRGERAPRAVEIVVTRHGPVINKLSRNADSPSVPAIALQWIGREPNMISRAFLRLNRARNWDEFRAALGDFHSPAMNVVYADRAGNIGYQLAGRVPVRARGLGLVPSPGASGEHEWIGRIPDEELPYSYNPPQHYLVSANNRIVGPEYPHYLGAETMNGHRARRITELLNASERLSAEDFARMQVDQDCTPARAFCALVARLSTEIAARGELARLRDAADFALRALATWDGTLDKDSVPGALYELLQYFAARRLFEPWLGEWTDHYLGVGFHPILNPVILARLDRSSLVAFAILDGDEREWFKEPGGRAIDRATILARALADALRYLQTAVGLDSANWKWGNIHPASFHHPLGARPPLDRIFNRGPYPYGGDTNTVWQAAFVPRLPIQAEGGFTASWRQILDCGDWDSSRGVHAPGQSGHPASPHYDDLLPLWLAGEYHPLLWSRARVELYCEARQILEP